MISSSSDDPTLSLQLDSHSGITYSLTSHTLSSPDFPACTSFTLTVATQSAAVTLSDLTVHPQRARWITESFFYEEVSPEQAPYIVEDLLADEEFVC